MYRKAFSLAILLWFLVMSTDAPSQTTQELVANIPFDFSVCGSQMPSGTYKVRPLTSANTRIRLVSSDDGRTVIMACSHDLQAKALGPSGRLVFNRYGNQYFLSEVWLPGEIRGSQLVKSQQEEALVNEVKGRKRTKVTVKVTEVKP